MEFDKQTDATLPTRPSMNHIVYGDEKKENTHGFGRGEGRLGSPKDTKDRCETITSRCHLFVVVGRLGVRGR